MKILHIIPSYAPAFEYGGTIVSSEGLCKALVEQGHDVVVCTTNMNGDERMPFNHEQAVQRGGVKVFYFPVSKIFGKLSARLYISSVMKKWLQKHISEFDVVHMHSVFLWPTALAAKYAKQNNIPYIVSPRGMLVESLIQQKSTLIKRLWIALIERRNLKHASCIHFTSEQEYQDALQLNIMFESHIIEPNGVELPVLLSDKGQLFEKGRMFDKRGHEGKAVSSQQYIIYLGRINWKKGLDILIQAFAKTELANHVQLVIAGNDDGYQNELQQLTERLNVAQRVSFSGFVKGGDKQGLLENAICLALCSDNENFGNVVLEALACGTPVIATKGVGAAKILEETKSGLVVEQTVDAVSNAIKMLINNPKQAERMGKNGSEAIQHNYSWAQISKNFVKHYQHLKHSKKACV